MQVLKEQVRSRILTAARQEFLKHGYAQASMRFVAERSDITVGNIYRYFSSKQSLFNEIVGPSFLRLKGLLESVQIDGEMPLSHDQYVMFRERFVIEIASVIEENRDEILILFNGSEGTQYASVMPSLSTLIDKTLETNVMAYISAKHSNQNLKSLSRMISKGIMESVNDVIQRSHEMSYEALCGELRMMIDFYFRDIVTRFDY
jgi:AcrR family transcriptional regulator